MNFILFGVGSIFKLLIEEGNKRLEQGSEIDFFAKFGENETENMQISKANLLIGPGYIVLGENTIEKENLLKAVDFSASNLWAGVELKGL